MKNKEFYNTLKKNTMKDNKKWYKKKRYMIPLAFLLIGAIGGNDDEVTTAEENKISIVEKEINTPIKEEPIIEEPIKEEPIKEEPKKEEPVKSAYDEIKERAIEKWEDNYSMQVYEYEGQIEAYEFMKNLSSEHQEIINRAETKWEGNYKMQRYEYQKQLKSKLKMKQI